MFDGTKIEMIHQACGYEYFSLEMNSLYCSGDIYDKLNDTMHNVMIQIDICH